MCGGGYVSQLPTICTGREMSCAESRQNRLLSQSRWARRLRSTNETSRSAVRGMPLRENGRPLSWRDLASPPQWRARQCWGPNHTAQRARIGVEFFCGWLRGCQRIDERCGKMQTGVFPSQCFQTRHIFGFHHYDPVRLSDCRGNAFISDRPRTSFLLGGTADQFAALDAGDRTRLAQT